MDVDASENWTLGRIRGLFRDNYLHRSAYCDTTLFELEMARIFGRAWLYVGHASQLKAPGDFFRTNLAGRDVIVVRDGEGKIHVLQNRCAHRGARVCVAEAGSARVFICPYHSWSYRLDGSLIGVPHRESYPADNAIDEPRRLHAAPRVDSYRGFIFASFASHGPALADHLGIMTAAIDNLVDRSPTGDIEVCLTPFRVEYPGNWKLHHENVADIFHPSFVHESSVAAASQTPPVASKLDSDQTREQLRANGYGKREWEGIELVGVPGGHCYMGGFYRSGVLAPKAQSDPVREKYQAALEARHGAAKAQAVLGLDRFNNFIYPNAVLNAQYHQLRVITPIAVNRTVVTAYCFKLIGAPDEIYQRAVRYLNNLSSPASMISSDDFEIFARCQTGLSEEGAEWVEVRRGMITDKVNADGTINGTATELPIRVQMHAWLDYMTADAAAA